VRRGKSPGRRFLQPRRSGRNSSLGHDAPSQPALWQVPAVGFESPTVGAHCKGNLGIEGFWPETALLSAYISFGRLNMMDFSIARSS
jgi:hypothetical protein